MRTITEIAEEQLEKIGKSSTIKFIDECSNIINNILNFSITKMEKSTGYIEVDGFYYMVNIIKTKGFDGLKLEQKVTFIVFMGETINAKPSLKKSYADFISRMNIANEIDEIIEQI